MFRVAILDLYEGFANQGMRCIRELLQQFGTHNNIDVEFEEYNVRQKFERPNLEFDAYISSGGPGSPLESEGSDWEKVYFDWLNDVEEWNQSAGKNNLVPKHVFFICHSFQLASRHFKVGTVCARKSTSFGVFPVHMLPDVKLEPIFRALHDPFYAVDSRDFQVIQPNYNRLRELGASILCIEKERPHVAFERAIMGIRFNQYFVGTQFHPEADAAGMSMHLQTEEKKKTICDNYGEEKWQSMIDQLNDPEKISYTHDHILPNFLANALATKTSRMQQKEAVVG